jgi:hypothetical protein
MNITTEHRTLWKIQIYTCNFLETISIIKTNSSTNDTWGLDQTCYMYFGVDLKSKISQSLLWQPSWNSPKTQLCNWSTLVWFKKVIECTGLYISHRLICSIWSNPPFQSLQSDFWACNPHLVFNLTAKFYRKISDFFCH